MPNRAAICGTRAAAARTAVSSVSSGSAGTDTGSTRRWTGENESASSTVAQRSDTVSAASAALVASISRPARSAGSGSPAFGGRELSRRARTTRPSAERRRDLPQPRALLLVDPAGQALAQRGRQGAGLVVAGRALGGHDDRAEVAQVELLEVGHRRLGPVPPLGGAQAGEQLLGQVDELVGLHLGLALGAGLLVLLGDRGPDGGDAALQDLLGDRLLLGRELGERGLAVGPVGPEPLRLGPGVHRRARGTGPVLRGAGAVARPAALGAAALAPRRTGSALTGPFAAPGRHGPGAVVAPLAGRPAVLAAAAVAAVAGRRGGGVPGRARW